MKRILISLMLFSTVVFSKELSFKMRVRDKIYKLYENNPIEFDYTFQDGTSTKMSVKIINTELDKNHFILEIVVKTNGNKEEYKFYKYHTSYNIYDGINLYKENNSFQLLSAILDDNRDFLVSSIKNVDNRKNNILKLNDDYLFWGNYSITYLKKDFLGLRKIGFIKNKGLEFVKHDKPNRIYKKQSVMQHFNIGIDKIGENNSLTGAYLIFGLENTKNFRTNYYDKNLELKNDENGVYTADTVATMFGIGVNRTQKFSNGIYYDALAQISTFNRKMSSHDGQYAKSRSYAVSASLETGVKFNVNSNFSITPQVQQVYHYYMQKSFVDSNDTEMPNINQNIFNTRLSLKATYKNIYGKVSTYLDYDKALNTVDIEGELGYIGKVEDHININSSISLKKEVYNIRNIKNNFDNYSIKLNLGVSY
ncbi:autotransporter outer membrane beta-barrel domain-containing protein [Sneathia vaginalis]|uniref:autotransporter outer membrane beta-barrel domain-containing protein n=1 Tax=Sneathia vaginalis TaxID=187101 RepID=UPI0035C72874